MFIPTRFIVMGAAVLSVLVPQLSVAQSLHGKNQTRDTAKADDGRITIMLPDVLSVNGQMKNGDTTYSFEYYDRELKRIRPYDLINIEQLDNAKYFKTFPAFAVPPGAVSAPTSYVLVYKFVHPAPGVWLRYDPISGAIVHYKIYPDKIVATDTLALTDPVSGNKRSFVYKYFKTEEINKPGK